MRKLPIGAEVQRGGVHFRVWAPKCGQVEVLLENGLCYPLKSENHGYFSGLIKDASAGQLYEFILDGEKSAPDPASRFQPLGPDGPSQILDPDQFQWSDHDWEGITDKSRVILYELHIGTFTEEGTWLSAKEKLPHLRDLGINVIELMPIAEWDGRFNWGYDGVDLFSPTHNYGTPDHLKSFINEAHRLGIGIILDVVYNHFGPKGNYIELFSDYFFQKQNTEWGKAVNFDGENCQPVREFYITNAGYWIEEFHFDGLRLDACHSIHDHSTTHILLQIAEKIREKGGRKRTYVIAENEKQQAHFVLPKKEGGYGFDAVWNEDFHHAASVRLTGVKEAYLSDYCGKPQEFISSLKFNFLYQGQWYDWQKKGRGSPALDIKAHHFVNFLENHDQVANTGNSLRLHSVSQPRLYRAMTALLLLSPQIPLLFQGQEFGSSSPFYYFCEQDKQLAADVYKGRLAFISQFKTFDNEETRARIPPPSEETTFKKSKLKWEELKTNDEVLQLHKDLIELRKNDDVFEHLADAKTEGSMLSENAFVIRYFTKAGERLLLVNLDIDFTLLPASEPLLAPPEGHFWKTIWTSDHPKYGGFGYIEIPKRGSWILSGYTTQVLLPEKNIAARYIEP